MARGKRQREPEDEAPRVSFVGEEDPGEHPETAKERRRADEEAKKPSAQDPKEIVKRQRELRQGEQARPKQSRRPPHVEQSKALRAVRPEDLDLVYRLMLKAWIARGGGPQTLLDESARLIKYLRSNGVPVEGLY